MTLKFCFRYFFRLLYRSKHQTRGSELGIIYPFVLWNYRGCSKLLRMGRSISCWLLLTRFRRWTADTMMVVLMTGCTCYSCLKFVFFLLGGKEKHLKYECYLPTIWNTYGDYPNRPPWNVAQPLIDSFVSMENVSTLQIQKSTFRIKYSHVVKRLDT